MTSTYFNEKHKAILLKHNVVFRDDCDLWNLVAGFKYYKKNEKNNDNVFVLHLTGVCYNSNRTGLKGDLVGYIALLDSELIRIAF